VTNSKSPKSAATEYAFGVMRRPSQCARRRMVWSRAGVFDNERAVDISRELGLQSSQQTVSPKRTASSEDEYNSTSRSHSTDARGDGDKFAASSDSQLLQALAVLVRDGQIVDTLTTAMNVRARVGTRPVAI
jgi:hypothetical protein